MHGQKGIEIEGDRDKEGVKTRKRRGRERTRKMAWKREKGPKTEY